MKFVTYCLIFWSGFIAAQDIPKWMRYPSISPDGQTVAFSYKGDLYTVATAGGVAVALTSFDGHDFRPVWSPDGQWLAFASNRHGHFDIYLISSRGGRATRLTYHSANDFPTDFTPDGSAILFMSRRMDAAASALFPSRGFNEVYRIGTDGGAPERVSTLPMAEARYNRDGSRLIYEEVKGTENQWRKHHRSSVTRDIVLFDTTAGAYRKLSSFEGEDRDPVFAPDGQSFFYLSEANGTFNVFKAALDAPENAEQITDFAHHPVRFLSISDDGTLCFGYHGEVFTLREGNAAEKVAVQIYRDDQDPPVVAQPVTSGAREMTLSPNGREIAFVYRGEVFVTSTESDRTRRITDTPEQERSVSFSPDGRALIYAGERNNSWNLYHTKLARAEEDYFFKATLLKEEPMLVTDAETFQPAYSPDGKEVAYLENRTTLKVLNLASGQSRVILPGEMSFSYADGDQYYQWSPDGKWFLVNFLKPNYWIPEVGLISADGKGQVRNLTRSGFPDLNPRWSMKGSMVLWTSSRDGMKSLANSGATQMDVYGMFLTRKAHDRFRLNEEDYELLVEKEKKEKKETKEEDKSDKKKKAKKKEKEAEEDKEDEPEPVTIDWEGLEERKVRLTLHSSNLLDAVITPDGETLLYLTRQAKGRKGMATRLWQTKPRTSETKMLFETRSGSGALALDEKGENAFVLAGGRIHRLALSSGKKKNVPFSAVMELKPAEERAYFFDHVWRQVVDKFYDPQLHGAAWDYYKDEYKATLDHINNNYDFVEMLSELLGELNASHTGARLRSSGGGGEETASLGVFFDESYAGPGLKILEIMDKSPLIQDGSRIVPGTVIEKIDGTVLGPGVNPYRLLNRKQGMPVLLSLLDSAGVTRWDETVEPVGQGELQQMLYQRWVSQRRELTDKLSNGRLGYVHVRSMSDPSYRMVVEEVLGRQANKEALIVDTRYNTGGDLVDDLSTFLNGVKYMDFKSPDGRFIGAEPTRKWTKPSIVLVSEGNYSDAHCFPYAYQTLEIGKIVGMPVAGTCTFVWWERLQDRTVTFGIPNLGIEVDGGTYLENTQLTPDIQVANEPVAVASGRDQQLERAVQELLTTLDNAQ